ncbi:beta-lactamase/transpeptidase-like protein [Apiosordaria backusii]|uniref:Beta-lactamase/transpeptidase-like protein n=1 Tax=Apiosordaria backusii TaxID=314023 RepID=A0AA40BJH0_9PEZI|nr:beta-lactamase/transpeptidase-like protein [Apiosordaria backusii]
MANETIEPAFEVAISNSKINGVIICATNTYGTFTYNHTTGTRTLPSGESLAHELNDILYLASGTKLIATIAALQAIDDCHLSLDSPETISQFAPELLNKPILSSDGETLTPSTNPITLRQLLSHTSGLAYHFLLPYLSSWRDKNEVPLQPGHRRPVEKAFAYPLIFNPGTSWSYGPNLDWAGRILERATNTTLGQHVQERICKPLAIPPQDAQFFPVKGDEPRSRMVDLNPSDPEGLGLAVVGGTMDMNKRSDGDFGGHGLFMTAEGYIKVLQSLLANDGKLLKKETVEEMFSNQIAPAAEENANAVFDGPTGAFYRVGTEGIKAGHGLGGLLTLEGVDGWYGEKTLTWGGGLSFAWFIDRANGLCGLCAIQPSMPVDMQTLTDLKNTFRHDIYRKYEAWKKEGQEKL